MMFGKTPTDGVQVLCAGQRELGGGLVVAGWNLGQYNWDYARPHKRRNYEIRSEKNVERGCEQVSTEVVRLICLHVVVSLNFGRGWSS
jgi:hypothetical protein